MPNTLVGSTLLEYDAKHCVLICRECQYAIQKSAVNSHLLRHKIYRGEKRRLLASIAQLELLEPDDVRLPPKGSPPVDGLPVISGYSCTATDCESLYGSDKRMRRHWSEIHGFSDPPSSFSRPVNLQTFFRGNKLRYFEVVPPTSERSPAVDAESITGQQDIFTTKTPIRQNFESPHPFSPLSDWDLETLRYFHHFTTTTSLTLPAETHDFTKYWQIDIVDQALRSRWLMCGLLAISASHLAVLSDEETTKLLHWTQSKHFQSQFCTKWEEVKNDSGMAKVHEAKVAAQMVCIQRCYRWTSESPAAIQETNPEPEQFDLQSFIATIQGCADSNFALRSEVSTEDMLEERRIQARSDLAENPETKSNDNTPPEFLIRLRALPYRMAEVLDKPENAMDFFAAMSAINALVECCSLSYSTDEMRLSWAGMESWLRKLSDHFIHMMLQHHYAALIVLAQWSVLVERVERDGWFLKGSAKLLVRLIARELPNDRKILSLLEGLGGN
jgi:Orsellinic acid/F9775 biosynthesis cluster protein D